MEYFYFTLYNNTLKILASSKRLVLFTLQKILLNVELRAFLAWTILIEKHQHPGEKERKKQNRLGYPSSATVIIWNQMVEFFFYRVFIWNLRKLIVYYSTLISIRLNEFSHFYTSILSEFTKILPYVLSHITENNPM